MPGFGFVTAYKSEQGTSNFLEADCRWGAITPESLLVALNQNYGTDISLYTVSDDTEDFSRLQNGDEFSIVWTGNEITGLDWTPEDSKPIVKTTASKTVVAADGVDSVDVRIEVWKPDNSGILTTMPTKEYNLPIVKDRQLKTVRVYVENGVMERTGLTKTTPMSLTIPGASKRYKGFRIENNVEIEFTPSFDEL